jgi:hypothetical protein
MFEAKSRCWIIAVIIAEKSAASAIGPYPVHVAAHYENNAERFVAPGRWQESK